MTRMRTQPLKPEIENLRPETWDLKPADDPLILLTADYTDNTDLILTAKFAKGREGKLPL